MPCALQYLSQYLPHPRVWEAAIGQKTAFWVFRVTRGRRGGGEEEGREGLGIGENGLTPNKKEKKIEAPVLGVRCRTEKHLGPHVARHS